MENTLPFIKRVAAIFIFCMALSQLFVMKKQLESMLTSLKNNVNSEEVLYEQAKPNIDKAVITYKDVVGEFLNGIEYDTQINGQEITEDTFEYSNFNYSLIARTDYRKSYILDDSGNIKKIIYESV